MRSDIGMRVALKVEELKALANAITARRKELADQYGAFRVLWTEHTDAGGVRYLSHAGDGYMNEGDATTMAVRLEHQGLRASIEHQDPETKEWRRW